MLFRSGEFFNIFNRPTFDIPAQTVFSGSISANLAAGAESALATAGQINSTRNSSRQIQFSLKLLF